MQYRREIDGLRAVAVLPVILFHAGVHIFGGGFVGVDVFFVISGYLITSLLIAELERGDFSIIRFYERRARRILPALFFVIIACLPFAYLWMLPSQIKDFGQSIIAVVMFLSNILFWREEGYFSAAAELKPLLHTWSLAVEEQYYLLFPPFLFVAWRFGRSHVFWAIVAIAAASLLLSEWSWRNSPSANFYLAFTRAWELLAGSICAFLTVGRHPRSSGALSALGLALIVFSIFYYTEDTPFPSIYALVPVLGAVFVILFTTRDTLVSKLLGSKLFVSIGLISYSAYLWHQPLFAFARLRSIVEPNSALMAFLAVLSFVLAFLTWRYVEQPFRKRSHQFAASRYQLFLFSGIVGAILISVGFLGTRTEFFKSKFHFPSNINIDQISLPDLEDGFCFYDFNVHPDLKVKTETSACYFGNTTSPNKVLLFGDSFAAQWEPYFKLLAERADIRIDILTTNWCFPTDNEDYTAPKGHVAIMQCKANRDFLAEHIDDYQTVILGGHWSDVFKKGFSSGVVSLVKNLIVNSDAKFVFLDAPPQYERLSVEHNFYLGKQELILSEKNALAVEFWDYLKESLSGETRVQYLEKTFFGENFSATGFTTAEFPYSLDGSHISVYGATQLFIENQGGNVERMRAILGN